MFVDPCVIYVGVAQVREGSNDGNVADICGTFFSWFYQQVSTVFGIFFFTVVHALHFIFEIEATHACLVRFNVFSNLVNSCCNPLGSKLKISFHFMSLMNRLKDQWFRINPSLIG